VASGSWRIVAARDASVSPWAPTRSSRPLHPDPRSDEARDLSPARGTFGRARRVRKRADFQRIQASAKRVTTRHFVLLVAARDNRAPSRGARLGLVASRRTGGAVSRNRVKRLCRECFRRLQHLLPDEVDLVVIARTGADSLKLQEVLAEWEAVVAALQRHAREALARRGREPHVSGRTPGGV
jgi:ribonuclease P protein component